MDNLDVQSPTQTVKFYSQNQQHSVGQQNLFFNCQDKVHDSSQKSRSKPTKIVYSEVLFSLLQVGMDADLDDGCVRHYPDPTKHRSDVRGTQHHQARRSLVPGTLSYIFWYHP